MRNATSIGLFGATALGFTLLGACGGGGDGTRSDGTAGSTTNAGNSTTIAGSSNPSAGNSSTAGNSAGGNASAGTSAGGTGACTVLVASKHGDGTTTVIDELDDTNTMFSPAGMASGTWDWGKDTAATAMGTITPANTTALLPVTGGHMGSALHVTGTGLTGWGAALAAFLNGTTGAYDASMYGGVAFWIKGTADTQDGMNKVMVQVRMPDVLPGTPAAGSCCDDKVVGQECYSGHRIVIDVPADWKEVKIAWADLKGPAFGLGSTLPFNANRIRDIDFSFNHDAKSTTAVTAFDFWVDGLRFMTTAEMGNVMPGGSGGAAAGGSGGAAAGGSGGSGGATGGSGGTGGAAAGTGGI